MQCCNRCENESERKNKDIKQKTFHMSAGNTRLKSLTDQAEQSPRQNSPKLCLQRLIFGLFFATFRGGRVKQKLCAYSLLRLLKIFCKCSQFVSARASAIVLILEIFCYILIIQLFIILVAVHHFGMAAGCFDRSVLHINYLFHTRRSLKRMRDYN